MKTLAGPHGATTGDAHRDVLAAFRRYEAALVEGDVAAMTEAFLDSPQTTRFGLDDHQVGAREIAAWRARQRPVPAGRRLSDTRVVVLSQDAALVTTLFDYPGSALRGRQSQTWIRTQDGWRILHAHVSARVPADRTVSP